MVVQGLVKAKVVKERLRRWSQGEYRSLWDEAVKMMKTPSRPKGRRRTGEEEGERIEKSQEENNVERAKHLGQYS